MEFLVGVLFAVNGLFCAVNGAIVSANPTYSNFRRIFTGDSRVRIPYFINTTAYNSVGDSTCPGFIRAAVAAMNLDLLNCIEFGPQMIDPTKVIADFLYFSPVMNTGLPPATCITPLGRVNQDNPINAAYKVGQKVIIMGASAGAASCCDSTRSVMRMLAGVLGLHEEFRRPNAITPAAATFNTNLPAVLQPLNLYAPLAAVAYRVFKRGGTDAAGTANPFGVNPADTTIPFDFNSITMVATNKYTMTGAAAFALAASGGTIPVTAVGTQARVSLRDCQAISAKYGCVAAGAVCANPYSDTPTDP